MIRPIHPGLSPNVEQEDAILAFKNIVFSENYRKENYVQNLEEWFEKRYKEKAIAVSSGRGALYLALAGLGIGKDDEVLVTGFTCIAVVDAILATGAKPVYFDITDNFLVDTNDLERKITKKTKILLLQHTFGIPSINKEILNIVKKHNLFLVEDVAHAIGTSSNGKLLGTFGKVGIFSFGRDKAFSCVNGGIVITKDKNLYKKILSLIPEQMSSDKWIFQSLFHIVSFYFLILPFYDLFSIGKILLVVFQKLGLLGKPIDKKELLHFSMYTKKLAPALSQIALGQLQRLNSFNSIRTHYVHQYNIFLRSTFPKMISTTQPLLRLPLLISNPHKFKKFLRRKNIYIGDWYSNTIDPKGTDITKLFYKKGLCPKAEYIAQHIINLPTYPTLSDNQLRKVISAIKQYA